jgi:hypothetical protein
MHFQPNQPSMNSPGGAPFVQVGHPAPMQPQQPLSVSVGVKPMGPPQPQPGHEMPMATPPPAPYHSPAPESMEPSPKEKQLMAELSEKNALLEKYRVKTRGLGLGVEGQASPSATAPAGGPGAKMATSKPRASLGSASKSLPLPGEMREAADAEKRKTDKKGSVSVGVQNTAGMCNAFCQTDDAECASTTPQLASFADPAVGVAEGILQGSKLCDALGRLPTSRAINVHLFTSVHSQQLNSSFAGLPPALGSSQYEQPPSPPSGGAATLPLATGNSWSEEPAPPQNGSSTMPSGRHVPGTPKRGGRGRGDDDSRRRGGRGR